jgi:hypothetical protein
MSYDIGSFLSSELDRIGASQGGVIEYPTSTGMLEQTSNVLKDMGSFPGSIHVDGRNQHVRLKPATQGEHALMIANMGTGVITFEHMLLSGDPDVTNDCASAICILSAPITANVRDSRLVGLRSSVSQQGIIRCGGRHTTVSSVHFGGCAASGSNSGLISLFMDTHKIERCFFHRQATFGGTTYNKNGGSSLIYVRANAALADPSNGPVNRPLGCSLIEQNYIEDDSVTVAQIHCCPIDEPGLDHILTRGNVFNVPSNAPSVKVQNGNIENTPGFGHGTNRVHSSHDTFHGTGTYAFDVENLDELVIEHATVQSGIKKVKIGPNVGEVWIWRSPGIEVDTCDHYPSALYIDGVVQ